MAIERLRTPEQAEAYAKADQSKRATAGKPPNVLTPPEKDAILLTMAEALGFYKPA